MDTGFIPEVKRQGLKADHSATCNAEVKNGGATLPCAFIRLVGLIRAITGISKRVGIEQNILITTGSKVGWLLFRRQFGFKPICIIKIKKCQKIAKT
jgi:hypothetical protein